MEYSEDNKWFREVILRPMCMPPDIRVSHTLDEFNKDREDKFTLVR